MSNGPQSIRLADGRRLGYAEHGRGDGAPVFLFHGTPGSRLPSWPYEAAAGERGVRVVTTDRPGYGVSDPNPARTLLDWAQDVAALADRLGVEKFAVVAKSGGAPHAAACARALRERVTAAVLTSCPPPSDLEGAGEEMSYIKRGFFLVGRHAAALMDLSVEAFAAAFSAAPEMVMGRIEEVMSEPDRELLQRDGRREFLRRNFLEAYRNGAEGHVRDMEVLDGPWGFGPGEIRQKVHLWHGTEDEVIPPHAGKLLAAAVPDCEFELMEGAGHMLIERDDCWRHALGIAAESLTGRDGEAGRRAGRGAQTQPAVR